MENKLSAKKYKQLCASFLVLQHEKEVKAFLRDLCTIKELEEMANRLEAVFLIQKKVPYREIASDTGLSTATVTRIAHWLYHGEGGYRTVLRRYHRK